MATVPSATAQAFYTCLTYFFRVLLCYTDVSLTPSTGTEEVPGREHEPSDDRNDPNPTVRQSDGTGQYGRTRRRDLPDGDSVTLRLARRFGLR